MNSRGVHRLLAAVVLALIALQRHASGYRSTGVEQYQAAIRHAAVALPAHFGSWIGQDVPVPVQALAVLKPNVVISRRYTNVQSGAVVGLLLVHCGNAHHMAGHFPLRCYPAAGWQLRWSAPRDWDAAGLHIAGTEYQFDLSSVGGARGEQCIIVVNSLLRPRGQILRDMDGLSQSVMGAGGAAAGAGQLQVYFNAAVPRPQRDAAVEAVLGGCKPLIQAILADPGQ